MNDNKVTVIIPRMSSKRISIILQALKLAKEGKEVHIIDYGDGKDVVLHSNKPINELIFKED